MVDTALSLDTPERRVRAIALTISDVLSLAKPRLSSLVICTAAGGMWLAPGVLPWPMALVALASVAMLVFTANAMNCVLERDADALMTRTASRPLPNGRLDPKTVAVSSAVIGMAATVALGLSANWITAALGVVAYLSYIGAYTPLKKTSASAVFVGAVPGALPALMGWTAATGRLDYAGFVLFGIMFLWQVPHFIAIAFYRREDYLRSGFKTLPLVTRESTTKIIMVSLTVALIPVSVALVPFGVETVDYGAMAAGLGAGYLIVNCCGFLPQAGTKWARLSLHASLFYITALFAAMAYGARLGS
ncbi:MAG: protoheme IX farnesyltransferase [Clostridia bacterium]|nr:protoheme IX farnesyltransferase [Deltaproteobacteria bacterium]